MVTWGIIVCCKDGGSRSAYSSSVEQGIQRHLLLCPSPSFEILNRSAFCFLPFRLLLWLFLAPFLGLIVALDGEEQRKRNQNHLLYTGSR